MAHKEETAHEETDFLQSHSLRFLEMAFRTDRQETIDHPDGFGKKSGDCGDTITFYLMVKDDRIERISYKLEGCMHTNACANTIAELAQEKSLDQCWEITPETLIEYLETLPADHIHCAELAVGAFYLALARCRETKRSPWKRLYETSKG